MCCTITDTCTAPSCLALSTSRGCTGGGAACPSRPRAQVVGRRVVVICITIFIIIVVIIAIACSIAICRAAATAAC